MCLMHFFKGVSRGRKKDFQKLASKTLYSQHSLKLQRLSGEQWHKVLKDSAHVSDFLCERKIPVY